MSYVDDISQYLDQLGENKITEVVRIVDERQFSRDRSSLDFDTAVERLRSCRDIVLGTIENGFFLRLTSRYPRRACAHTRQHRIALE